MIDAVQPDQKLAFPYLGAEGLEALCLLDAPIYIYSFATQRVCWANRRALAFWNAGSQAELTGRQLGPFSRSTSVRLADYRDDFRRGAARVETWVFYPKGVATRSLCHCRGVRLDGHDEAMLVEIKGDGEAQLPASELRAIEALRHIPLMITLFSSAGEILTRNPAALAAFGELDRSLPAGANCFRAMFAHPADADALLREAEQAGVASSTATMAIAGGPSHSVQLSIITDPANAEPALLVAQQDVTSAIRLSRELAASEEALDIVLALNVAPAVVLSGAGAVLKANPAAAELLGAGLVDRGDLASCFGEPDQFRHLHAAVLATGVATGVITVRDGSDHDMWCSVSGCRIRYGHEDAVVLIITNVDRLYKTKAELEAALDTERRTSEMQRRMITIAAHEFRTPLAVIDSTAQQLERRAASLPPEQVAARAGRIRSSVAGLLRLLDLTFERSKANLVGMGFAPERASARDVLEAVARHFRESHPHARLDCEIPDLPELDLDVAMLEQALLNLLGNAVKYSDGSPHITLSATAGAGDVRVFVRDRGIGIDPAERDAVFDEGVRGSNVGERPGTGLGLSIVRQIVQLHGGDIAVTETADGPGTTLCITIPRA